MELIPALEIGWLNGWIPWGLLCLTDGILFMVFPKDMVARLFDRSGWNRRQTVFTVTGKLIALVCLVLIILTPLKIGDPVFIIGMALVALGLVGLIIALFDFKNTSFDQPGTKGLYRVSRHPQIFRSSVVLLGACIAVGSWLALFILVVSKLFLHFGILAEEEICLGRYGDSYRAYVKQVPRYFLFF